MLNNLDNIISLNADISDEEALYTKELCTLEGEFTNKYYTLYKNYKILLDKYLLNRLSLKQYDNMINNSNLRFIPVDNNDMDYYQYISTMGLNFIYLTNNIYVEKLSNEDINKIINRSYEELVNPSSELMDIVSRTYENIICDSYDNTGKLSFGIREDDFADNGITDSMLREDNYDKQQEYLNNIIKLMQDNANKKIGNDINVTLYNEFNLKRKISIR